MLAPWIWSLVTVIFLLGIKIYKPPKSNLPVILMGWSACILIVSTIVFLDRILLDSTIINGSP
ncbi:hypothetical protein N752_23200 [Desulforamulus aquiferis]|nr:hypothetical protein N752_23200 [Desulforamulus aquiferis]